jgi:EAL domain-containing protein (putative c-di-GMP-specific phosphodiesterase class I)
MNRQDDSITRKYRILFNNAPMSILLLDHEGAIEEANPEASRLFEASVRELMDKRISSLLVPVSSSGQSTLWRTDERGMPLLSGEFDVLLGGHRKRVKAKSETFETGDTYSQYVMLLDISEALPPEYGESEAFRMDAAIRRGLENGEFLLHYQPQVDIQSGDIIGAEALIRWSSPDKGLIPPLEFIPLAEKTGVILDIGYWVLETGCRQMQEWRRSGLPPVRLSINLSASQFMDPFFSERLKEVLNRTGVNPRDLCLEITESTAVKTENTTTRQCREISELGVRLAIDDFGMEYSSLSLLKRLEVDMIKIDRSFVKDMLREKQDLAIIHAIIALSHGLGKRVIAEGVEELPQWERLETLGCDEIQGYYISKPVDPEQFKRLMVKGQSL